MALPPRPAPTDPRLPRRPNPRPQAQAFPLLPLVAAALLLLAAGQVALWLWQASVRDTTSVTALPPRASGNPFVALKPRPTPVEPAQLERFVPRRVVMPAEPSNLQFGAPVTDRVLTVLSDPSCGDCRTLLQKWLRNVPKDVRVVYKFWPTDPARLTPGIAVEMARRHNVVGAFWQDLEASEGDLDDLKLLSMLEKAGLPLERQRAELASTSSTLPDVLEADITRARELDLPPPPVLLLNGYVLDGRVLHPQYLTLYLQRLRDNAPLVQADDYWLMRK